MYLHGSFFFIRNFAVVIIIKYYCSVFRFAGAHSRTPIIKLCSQFVLKLTNMTKDGMSIHMDGQLSMFRLRPCPCCMAAGFSPETIRNASSVKTWYIGYQLRYNNCAICSIPQSCGYSGLISMWTPPLPLEKSKPNDRCNIIIMLIGLHTFCTAEVNSNASHKKSQHFTGETKQKWLL